MAANLGHRPQQLVYLSLVAMMLAGCAINDSGGKPTPPPITLAPPAVLAEQGTCDITPELEDWLQVTVPTRQQFQSRLNEAAAKNAADIHDDTLFLASLRDTVASTKTPDCSVEVQRLLIKAMSGAVAALQGRFNGTLSGDLDTALADPIKQLNQVAAIQDGLVMRMKNQYQLENNAAATPAK